jgi:hypothetical protein
MTIRVVHYRSAPVGAVYVGRAAPRFGLKASPLANPFKITSAATRAAVIAQYRQWLTVQLSDPTSPAARELARLAALAGDADLTLACWCAPEACHADVIKEWIEQRREGLR